MSLSPTALPVHLITGLLGSGKTTALKQLLKQKPVHETWGLIINEFGEVDIDAASLHGLNDKVVSVAGGCICCSAQYGLSQAINRLLSNAPPETPYTRLFIEPTGLGHPAKIIDALKQPSYLRPLSLQKVICVMTPQQLTADRWQKSAVMRDLVTLSDTILLNKSDLSTAEESHRALKILARCYPAKAQILHTQQGKIALTDILGTPSRLALSILQTAPGPQAHQHQLDSQQISLKSTISSVTYCQSHSHADTGELSSIGWIFRPETQFNRIKLKVFFNTLAPTLLRAKGLLKTGNEWQLIQWSESGLTFDDIAWRQDSRLELIFATEKTPQIQYHIRHKDIEFQLLNCIHRDS